MTHSYVWQDSFTWKPIPIPILAESDVWDDFPLWHDSFTCATWLLHMCDMTHPFVSRCSFICFTRLTYMKIIFNTNAHWIRSLRRLPPACVWHDSFICVTWLMHTCDMTQHDSFSDRLIHVRDMTHLWCDSFIRVKWLFHIFYITKIQSLVDTLTGVQGGDYPRDASFSHLFPRLDVFLRRQIWDQTSIDIRSQMGRLKQTSNLRSDILTKSLIWASDLRSGNSLN